MIDISIPFLSKKITSDRDAKEFLSKNIKISEKFDGTKLTLLRNDAEFDSSDYTKNWIVSYKEKIINPEDFEGIENKEDIKKLSIGPSQYYFVHEHLKKVHKKTEDIPKNTELFLEFLQNKNTLTRTYKNFHKFFLLSFAKVEYDINNNILSTFPLHAPVFSGDTLERYSEILDISLPPVLFEGELSSFSEMIKGCKNDEIKDIFYKYKDSFNFNEPKSIISMIEIIFTEIESTQGGIPEGAVIQTEEGQFYKILQQDQHDFDVRYAKRTELKMSEELEKRYWEEINKLADDILNRTKDLKIISKLSYNDKLIFKIREKFPEIKKNNFQIEEDIFLTTKNKLNNLKHSNIKSTGLLPISGKPIHDGHWKLIEIASKENDTVIIFTSKSSRLRKGEYPVHIEDMVYIWKNILKNHLPKNVTLRFTDSPVAEIYRFLKRENSKTALLLPIFSVYSDMDDITKWNETEMQKIAPNIANNGKFRARGIGRNETTLISGTQMRKFLENNDKESFEEYLPYVLSKNEKEKIWNVLKKEKKENRIKLKNILKEVINGRKSLVYK